MLVVGAGIIGLAIARELKQRWPDQKVSILEKESDVAMHASGRNSGVIHAGFYYHPDSLKARLTNSGNKQLRRFCDDHGLQVNRCGKLVVASSKEDLDLLDELFRRGTSNGVSLEMVSDKQAKEIEPRVRTISRAIYSPDTSAVDPVAVTRKMAEECETLGVNLLTGESFQSGEEQSRSIRVRTSRRVISAGFLVNAAGLYADRIAHEFGVGTKYQMQPFKGLYLYANDSFGELHTHVYPVPDIRNPFLGVHFTVTVDGRVKIGPTATPALWREQYGWSKGFNMAEFIETGSTLLKLLGKPDSTMRRTAAVEMSKYIPSLLVRQAARIIPGVTTRQFDKWGRPGIRAQLVDMTSMTLVNDFLIEKSLRTMHILNAVSPAFTSSLPFAALAVDELADLD